MIRLGGIYGLILVLRDYFGYRVENGLWGIWVEVVKFVVEELRRVSDGFEVGVG